MRAFSDLESPLYNFARPIRLKEFSREQAAAIAALAKWKNDSQFPKLISYIKDEKDRDLRANAFNQALTFLVRDRQRESDQLQGLWESVAGLAETRRR